MSVKIIIADDEHGVLLLLGSILNELEDAIVVGTAENAIEAIKLVKEKSPDVAFLEIELPDMMGIELAENLRKIKPNLALVFIAANQEYSLEAFRLYAFDYILKPIDPERVKTTFRRIQQMLKIQENNPSNLNLHTTRISINLGNERVFVKLNEIFYIEKTGRHTFIHCSNGKYKTRETLQELEQHLGNGFFRSHKSYIINTDWIERIVNYPNSSYYEVKFKNCQGRALLSRDRIQDLMSHSDLNVLRG